MSAYFKVKVCKLCFPSLVVFTIGENDDFRKKAKFTHFTRETNQYSNELFKITQGIIF